MAAKCQRTEIEDERRAAGAEIGRAGDTRYLDQRIIDRAVQLHGGAGVCLGSEVERLYREIRPLRIYEGTTEIQKLIIAKGLLG